jgi:hypothetical protein
MPAPARHEDTSFLRDVLTARGPSKYLIVFQEIYIFLCMWEQKIVRSAVADTRWQTRQALQGH